MSRPPQGAAGVILCRNPFDLEIFWVRRQDALPFLGGFHAFPGGRVSPGDDPAAYGLEDSPGDIRLRLCALRELYEETGILLARPATGSRGASPSQKNVSTAESVARGSSTPNSFAAALQNKNALPDIEALVPAGRWVTPPFHPLRFDTSFYLGWAPEGVEITVHDGELSFGGWVRPEAALDEWSAGRALLAPPTLYALRGLEGAALEASGNDLPVDLVDAAQHLTGAPEAQGGDVTRIEMRPGFFLYPMKTRTIPPATHTNAFLVGAGRMVLIDPGSGEAARVQALLAFIDRLGTEGRSLAEIWLTHHHPDHVGGAAAIARTLRVPVRAHPITAERLQGDFPVEGSLEDGVVRDLPGRPGWRLRVIHTPGHTRGHISILEEVSGSLIAGDMVAGTGFIVIDPPEGDMAIYLESLQRLAGLEATVIFPSHGGPTAGVRRLLEGYIAHRLEREEKIVAALAGAAGEGRSPAEMLPEVYVDVSAALHPLAARSLLAHLQKLVAEGRVAVRGERYRLVGTP